MSVVRDQAEQAGAPLLSVHRRVDALLLAMADVYRKFDALAVVLNPEATDEATKNACATMADTEARDGIYEAEAHMKRNSPEAVDAWMREREAKKKAEPWYSTIRGRHRETVLIDGKPTKTSKVLDQSGQFVAYESNTPEN